MELLDSLIEDPFLFFLRPFHSVLGHVKLGLPLKLAVLLEGFFIFIEA